MSKKDDAMLKKIAETIPPQTAVKTGAGISMTGIVLLLAGYVSADHVKLAETCVTVADNAGSIEEMKRKIEAIEEIRTDVAVIKSSMEDQTEDIKEIKEMVKDNS